MDLNGKNLIFLDEFSFGVSINTIDIPNIGANIRKFIEEIKSKDEENYQYPKYICNQEKLNSEKYSEIDFRSPVYFFTYKSIENAINKIDKTVTKYNKAMEQIQRLEQYKEQNQIYEQLYLGQLEQIPQLNLDNQRYQIDNKRLEEEIITLQQNQVQNSKLDCKCYEKDNRIYELQNQCSEHRTKYLQEIQQNKNKDQKILELSNQINNLIDIHQQEIDKVQQQEKYKYLQLLSNQDQICQVCKKSEGIINSLNQKYEKLNNEYQTYKENVQQSERNNQSQINKLQSEFCKKNSQQCKCEEKDKSIEVLQTEIQNLKKQVADIERKFYKYKQSFDENSVDLEKSRQRYENLYKINQTNLEQIRLREQQNQNLKQHLAETKKQTLENSQQILNYQVQFKIALQEKIDSDKLLTKQLQQFDPNSKDSTIQQLKLYIQNQQKCYDKLFEDNLKFKETYRDAITQITQHTAKQSIIRASQISSQN